ncbi:hypothetical protein [Halorussus sp. MSC15.2]|uniref:hypothetical protein n=1 Tax=Halorussus sp. MSC15.2 TaxID=2283638 RepID=UPI0013CF53EE|nr:hypothetical protein [Halorussus sp. MSC15.2]NEU58916.1 hypothetical protein [Halorussus sp. MSC15.2]
MPELTEDDVANAVVDGEGNRIGIVADVEDGTAYVDPADDLAGPLKTKLDWGADTKDTYPLRNDAIADVTDDEVRLRDEYVGH